MVELDTETGGMGGMGGMNTAGEKSLIFDKRLV